MFLLRLAKTARNQRAGAAEKHCAGCGKDLRLIAEETSERYEYIPASMKVIQDVCLK